MESICLPNGYTIYPWIMPYSWRITCQNHKILLPKGFVMWKKEASYYHCRIVMKNVVHSIMWNQFYKYLKKKFFPGPTTWECSTSLEQLLNFYHMCHVSFVNNHTSFMLVCLFLLGFFWLPFYLFIFVFVWLLRSSETIWSVSYDLYFV